MKRILVLSLGALLIMSCGGKSKKSDYKLNDFDQKLSYAIGYDVASNIKKMDFKIDKDLMVKGIEDALNDSTGKPLMTQEEMELVFQEFQKKMMENMQQQQSDLAAPNRVKGQEFTAKQMAENPGYRKTSTGLVYLVIKEGKGKKPGPESVVDVNYVGTLIDGTMFDKSGDTPATFKVNEVIKGWTEGLQLMTEGSKYKFIIPDDLAYGNNAPQGTPIQPGSTLVFEVELLKVQK